LRYNFEWDPAKAKENLHNHKVSFERAATVFLDPRAISIFDEEHSSEEERWITLGIDRNGVLLVACHTYRDVDASSCEIRIISARKATKKEMRQYEER
jgi:uncharacterized DUF497 family protein